MALSIDSDTTFLFVLLWLGVGALIGGLVTQWLGRKAWRRETDRLGAALEQATDLAQVGILRMDAGRRTVYANRAMTRLSGLSESELLAGGWGHGIFPDDRDQAIAELRMAFGLEQPIDVSYRFLRPDGTVLRVRHRGTPLRERGRFAGYLGTFADVSEELRLADEIAEVRRLAEEVNRRRFDFLSHAGHEIRTPLGGVIGMINLLLRTELKPAQRDLANAASGAADRLLFTLEDLLDFTRIEAGRLELDVLEFDLRATIEEMADQTEPRAKEKGLELTVLCPPNLPDRVSGDPARVRQVLRHLVKQAIDSSVHGDVTIAMEVVESTEQRALVRFEVTDFGPCLREEEQPQTIDSPRPSGGIADGREWGGLDLTLSKQLVDRLGGTVGFTSRPGMGNTRWFTLPLEIRDADLVAPTPRAFDLTGVRALVVDDHPVNRELLRRLLEAWGMESICAAAGKEALDLLEQENAAARSVQVVLLDMQMPGMNGLELARRLKGSAWRRVPLILLSSMVSRGQAREAFHAGFSAYLTKPLRADLLRDTIAALLSEETAKPGLVTRHVLSEAKRRRRPRALVAVLEPSQRNRLVRDLVARRFRVDIVSDTASAAESIMKVGYQLAFIDALGPGLDALALAARVREAEGRDRHTPLIALAGDQNPLHRSAAFAYGLDGVLPRLIEPLALDAVILRWAPVGADSGEAESPDEDGTILRDAA